MRAHDDAQQHLAGHLMTTLLHRLWHSPTATTWGSLAVRLASVLVILPLVLVRFAPPEVALWQLFTTMFMLALMLDFGLAPTFARLFAYARGGATLAEMARMQHDSSAGPRTSDPAVATAVMAALRWLYPRMAVCVTLVLAVLGTLGLMNAVSQSHDTMAAWSAWALVLATTGVALWGGAYAAALQGMNKIAIMRRWDVVIGLGQMLTSVAVLSLGGELLALVAAYQAWVVVGAMRNRWLLKHLHPELFTAPPAPLPAVMKVMWPPAWRSGLGALLSHGVIHASGLVYSQLAPAVEVAAYLLAVRLIMLISQFCQAPFYTKLPRMAELQAAGQQAQQLHMAQRGMRIAYWVFVAGALAVAFAVEPLLQAIGSRTPFVAPGVWALLAMAFFAERFGAMHLQLYSLTNHIVWHIANGVTGVVMVVVAVLAYPRFGQYAFPAAMLFAYLSFYCVYSAAHTRAAFKLHLFRFESSTVMPAAAALVAGLWLCLMFPVHL